MEKTYLIADTHFGDDRIRRYESRPFSDTAQMDEALIQRWNSVVGPEDRVYVLGDFGGDGHETEVLSRLRGRKFLVKGNHDSIPEYPENDTSVYETYLKQLGYDTQIDGWYEEEGSLANSYITLTVGKTDWLILTIDQNHTLEEIEAALRAAGFSEVRSDHHPSKPWITVLARK